jgi:hypothetical protein
MNKKKKKVIVKIKTKNKNSCYRPIPTSGYVPLGVVCVPSYNTPTFYSVVIAIEEGTILSPPLFHSSPFLPILTAPFD